MHGRNAVVVQAHLRIAVSRYRIMPQIGFIEVVDSVIGDIDLHICCQPSPPVGQKVREFLFKADSLDTIAPSSRSVGLVSAVYLRFRMAGSAVSAVFVISNLLSSTTVSSPRRVTSSP